MYTKFILYNYNVTKLLYHHRFHTKLQEEIISLEICSAERQIFCFHRRKKHWILKSIEANFLFKMKSSKIIKNYKSKVSTSPNFYRFEYHMINHYKKNGYILEKKYLLLKLRVCCQKKFFHISDRF